MKYKSLNIKGNILLLDEPVIMGILNVTPDSFFSGSRKETEKEIDERIQEILREGGTLIDVGGYSSRPGACEVDEKEEMNRLIPALSRLARHYPDQAVSVDTFRSAVARRAVEEYGVALVNDISGGSLDAEMFSTIAELQVPYVLMHLRGTPKTMQQQTDYTCLQGELLHYFASRVKALHLAGVNDVIIDPGFGFSKTETQNYHLLGHLDELAILELPLLVGLSRKSMIYNVLKTTPLESLNGTTVVHTIALLNGADILRVHDVKAAKEAVTLVLNYKNAL